MWINISDEDGSMSLTSGGDVTGAERRIDIVTRALDLTFLGVYSLYTQLHDEMETDPFPAEAMEKFARVFTDGLMIIHEEAKDVAPVRNLDKESEEEKFFNEED